MTSISRIKLRLGVELHSQTGIVAPKTAEFLDGPRRHTKGEECIHINPFLALVPDGLFNRDEALTVGFHCHLSVGTLHVICTFYGHPESCLKW